MLKIGKMRIYTHQYIVLKCLQFTSLHVIRTERTQQSTLRKRWLIDWFWAAISSHAVQARDAAGLHLTTGRKAKLVQGLASDLNTWQWEERRPRRGCTGQSAGTAPQAGCTPSSAPSCSPVARPPWRATGTYVKLWPTSEAPLLSYRALWPPQASGCSSKGKERLATLHCVIDLVYSCGGFTHNYSCFVRLGYFVHVLRSSIQVLTVLW